MSQSFMRLVSCRTGLVAHSLSSPLLLTRLHVLPATSLLSKAAHSSSGHHDKHGSHHSEEGHADHGHHVEQPLVDSKKIQQELQDKQRNETWYEFIFEEGWRPPKKREHGAPMRKEWYWFGMHPTDEYKDWKLNHIIFFVIFTVVFPSFLMYAWFRRDWPKMHEWCVREAYMEIAKREKYGLPYVSPHYIDPLKVMAQLPSDEEVGDFPIII